MGMALVLRQHADLRQIQEPRLEQRLDCTVALRQERTDSLETARRMFEEAAKVNVPISIGTHTVWVRAAILTEGQLQQLFEHERFAGIVVGGDERYQFFNRNPVVPDEVRPLLPELMAFHCLAVIRVNSFGDATGATAQYQAIALEMAYAKMHLGETAYAAYEQWRPTIERTDFFTRPDWRGIVARVQARFAEITEEMHRNAHAARFMVAQAGERFQLQGGQLRGADGREVPFFRARPRRRTR